MTAGKPNNIERAAGMCTRYRISGDTWLGMRGGVARVQRNTIVQHARDAAHALLIGQATFTGPNVVVEPYPYTV